MNANDADVAFLTSLAKHIPATDLDWYERLRQKLRLELQRCDSQDAGKPKDSETDAERFVAAVTAMFAAGTITYTCQHAAFSMAEIWLRAYNRFSPERRSLTSILPSMALGA